MASVTLQEIEQQVNQLPTAERLLLIERVVQSLRLFSPPDALGADHAAMAADPAIQRERAALNREFAVFACQAASSVAAA